MAATNGHTIRRTEVVHLTVIEVRPTDLVELLAVTRWAIDSEPRNETSVDKAEISVVSVVASAIVVALVIAVVSEIAAVLVIVAASAIAAVSVTAAELATAVA